MSASVKPPIPEDELWGLVDLAALPDSVRIDPTFNNLWLWVLRAKMWSKTESDEGKDYFNRTCWKPLQEEINRLLAAGRIDALSEFARAWGKWQIDEYSEMVELDEASMKDAGIDGHEGSFSLPVSGKKATRDRWPLKYYVAMAIIDLQLGVDRAPTNSEICVRIELYHADSKVGPQSISKAVAEMGLGGRLNAERELS